MIGIWTLVNMVKMFYYNVGSMDNKTREGKKETLKQRE